MKKLMLVLSLMAFGQISAELPECSYENPFVRNVRKNLETGLSDVGFYTSYVPTVVNEHGSVEYGSYRINMSYDFNDRELALYVSLKGSNLSDFDFGQFTNLGEFQEKIDVTGMRVDVERDIENKNGIKVELEYKNGTSKPRVEEISMDKIPVDLQPLFVEPASRYRMELLTKCIKNIKEIDKPFTCVEDYSATLQDWLKQSNK